MTDPIVVRLSFPAKPDYLLLARLALSGLARELPMDDELLADLKLAVTEACGNAVRHAYAPPAAIGEVTVSFIASSTEIMMIVEDQGGGLDAPIANDGVASDSIVGGMGMTIMKTIVDRLDVSEGADGRGTVVRMTKSLEPLAPLEAS